MDVLRAFNLRRTEQTSRADRRQRKNSAGGYTFTLDDSARRITGSSVHVSVGTKEYGQGALNVDARPVTDSISGRRSTVTSTPSS